MIATVVDTDALLKTAAAALVAAVGVTAIFSLALLGAVRFFDHGREGRSVSAGFAAALALVAFAATAAAVTIGIIVMTSK